MPDEPFFLARRLRAAARAVRRAEEVLRAVPAVRQADAAAEKVHGDWDDIPKAGINYKTSVNMKMDVAPPEEGRRRLLRRRSPTWTRRWARCSTRWRGPGRRTTRSSSSPATTAITSASTTSGPRSACATNRRWCRSSSACPGKKPAVCHSLVELLDLYPTIASLCGLEVPARLQGKDISRDVRRSRRTRCATRRSASRRRSKGFLLREDKWAYIQYAEDASGGHRAVRHGQRPQHIHQSRRQARVRPRRRGVCAKLAARRAEVQDNDLKPN